MYDRSAVYIGGGGTLFDINIYNANAKEKEFFLFDHLDLPDPYDVTVATYNLYIQNHSNGQRMYHSQNTLIYYDITTPLFRWNTGGDIIVYNPNNLAYKNYIEYKLNGSKWYVVTKPIKFTLRMSLTLNFQSKPIIL